ncbi:MAG: hypothetical protein RMK29_14595, partial [Myxococcales bacterium]|nr:hypothetical protein [Myxococcales bacterium]
QPSRAFSTEGDAVFSSLEPTLGLGDRLDARYVAYHVVAHREAEAWTAAARQGGPVLLEDVSGGVEILPLHPGQPGGVAAPLWQGPLRAGSYDIVVELAASAAEAERVLDARYDPAVDLLDGGGLAAFTVAADPFLRGPFAVGRAAYSYDDFFPVLGLATDVDLRAEVRYPAVVSGEDTEVAPGRHPIFLIQHGNHCFCDTDNPRCGPENVDRYTHASCPNRTPNHLGFVDLLELLASHGIIAVSIDAYDLTGLVPAWIEERGLLILRHLELWSHLSNPTTYPAYPDPFHGRFMGHVDLSRISIAGHSRGGEAAVSAWNNSRTFSIGSVAAIAPTDILGLPAPQVPFFVIVPAADWDVSDLSGVRLYDRAGSRMAPPARSHRSGIYIYGANHNFFNAVWAEHRDDSDPNRPDYLTPQEQQRVAYAYLSAFVRMHLLGQTYYLELLRGMQRFPSISGFKIFPMHQESQHMLLEQGSGTGAAPVALNAVPVLSPSVHIGQVLRIRWDSEGALWYPLPPDRRDLRPYQALSLRVAQTNAETNPINGSQDFLVELLHHGQGQAFYVGSLGPVPPPYRFAYLTEPNNVMTTVRLPLQLFVQNAPGLSLAHIDAVRLSFRQPPQGELYVDDIECSR